MFPDSIVDIDDDQYKETDSHAEVREALDVDVKTTLKKIKNIDHDFKEFFDTDTFYLPDKNTTLTKRVSTIGEKDIWRIVDKCEEYDLADQPSFPTFECPEGLMKMNI